MFRAALLSQLFLVATSLNFSATPSVLRAGATVSVSVAGVHDQKVCTKGSCCWVGLYLVGEDVNLTQPIEYQPVRDNSDTLTFRVINFRSSFVFYLFEGQHIAPNITVEACKQKILNTKTASHHHADTGNTKIDSRPAVVLAISNTVQLEPSSLYAPHAIRVSHTSDPTTLSVGFTSHPASGQAVVEWGETLDKLTQSALASGSEGDAYNATSLCGAPATSTGWRPPGQFHRALMHGLRRGARVFYRVGFPARGIWSPVWSVMAAPEHDSEVAIFAFGDLGEHPLGADNHGDMPASRNTTTGMAADLRESSPWTDTNYSLLLHNGDVSYARGYAANWEFFSEQIQPLSASLPYHVGLGNHERDFPNSGSALTGHDSGGECGVPTMARFHPSLWNATDFGHTMPKRDKPWWSLDHGPLHVIMVSSEHDISNHSEQHAFVRQDLMAVNRSLTPWVIFSAHRPYYISSTNFDPVSGDQSVATQLRNGFEDLLLEFQVDLSFGAHHHSYQRSCSGLYRSKCGHPGGLTVIDLGMAGAGNSKDVQLPQPAIWEVVDASHHGYCRIKANSTRFHLEYVRGLRREVFDSLTLTK